MLWIIRFQKRAEPEHEPGIEDSTHSMWDKAAMGIVRKRDKVGRGQVTVAVCSLLLGTLVGSILGARWLYSGVISVPLSQHQGLQAADMSDNYVLRRYNLTDAQLFTAASDAAKRPLPAGEPRVAFLFLVRGDIHHEPLWRRFFRGHEDLHSIYVHAIPGYTYAPGSIFHGKEIPSRPAVRFSIGLVDAVKRLLAYALLDQRVNNSWFINVCETTIPLRGLPFVYQYLTQSKVSFVESFHPVKRYYSWETMPEFPIQDLRKGEFWMALERRHAMMVVAETTIYFKFAAQCTWFCVRDEQYIQTMLYLKDRHGIANRTVMYVDWSEPHGGSPHTFDKNSISASFVQDLQSRTSDTDGAHHDTAADNTTVSCVHNGVPDSPCFLFARKFHRDSSLALQSLPAPEVLGY